MWIGKYTILRKPYDVQAQTYLTKKALDMNNRGWTVYIYLTLEFSRRRKDIFAEKITVDIGK